MSHPRTDEAPTPPAEPVPAPVVEAPLAEAAPAKPRRVVKKQVKKPAAKAKAAQSTTHFSGWRGGSVSPAASMAASIFARKTLASALWLKR